MRHMAYDDAWTLEAHNTLFIVRIYVKHFVDRLSRIQLHEQFEMDRISHNSTSPTAPVAFPGAPSSKMYDLDRHVVDGNKNRASL